MPPRRGIIQIGTSSGRHLTESEGSTHVLCGLRQHNPHYHDFPPAQIPSARVGGPILCSSMSNIDLDVRSGQPTIQFATPASGLFCSRRKNPYRTGFQRSQGPFGALEDRSDRPESAIICSTEHSDLRMIKQENNHVLLGPPTAMKFKVRNITDPPGSTMMDPMFIPSVATGENPAAPIAPTIRPKARRLQRRFDRRTGCNFAST